MECKSTTFFLYGKNIFFEIFLSINYQLFKFYKYLFTSPLSLHSDNNSFIVFFNFGCL